MTKTNSTTPAKLSINGVYIGDITRYECKPVTINEHEIIHTHKVDVIPKLSNLNEMDNVIAKLADFEVEVDGGIFSFNGALYCYHHDLSSDYPHTLSMVFTSFDRAVEKPLQ